MTLTAWDTRPDTVRIVLTSKSAGGRESDSREIAEARTSRTCSPHPHRTFFSHPLKIRAQKPIIRMVREGADLSRLVELCSHSTRHRLRGRNCQANERGAPASKRQVHELDGPGHIHRVRAYASTLCVFSPSPDLRRCAALRCLLGARGLLSVSFLRGGTESMGRFDLTLFRSAIMDLPSSRHFTAPPRLASVPATLGDVRSSTRARSRTSA